MNHAATIEIISPSRFVERDVLSKAVGRATQAGVTVLVSPACHLRANQFAGDDRQRAYDFTRAWMGRSDILWAARGGYGAGRILPLLQSRLARTSKTFIGYSDQTYLLAHIAKHRLGKAVHGPMPIDLSHAEKLDTVDTLLGSVVNGSFPFRWQSDTALREGAAAGSAVVGNLSILTRLIGTQDEPDWDNAVLFIEDVDEYLYAIDRMLLHLAEAGVFERISGLVLGNFTACRDNDVPFGETVEDMVKRHIGGRRIPIAMDAPFGHGAENRPIVFGAFCQMSCGENGVSVEVQG